MTAGCPSKVQGSGVPGGRLLAPHLPGQHAQRAAPKASAVQGREPQWPPGAKALCRLLLQAGLLQLGTLPVGTAILSGSHPVIEARSPGAHPRGQWQSAPSPQVLPEVPCSPRWVQKPCLGAEAPQLSAQVGRSAPVTQASLEALPHHALLLVWGGLVVPCLCQTPVQMKEQ